MQKTPLRTQTVAQSYSNASTYNSLQVSGVGLKSGPLSVGKVDHITLQNGRLDDITNSSPCKQTPEKDIHSVSTFHLPSGRIYQICNQKEKARQTQNTKQRHKRPQHTTYYSGPQMSRKEEQMQYKCPVQMQSNCTMLNTIWTLIHTKGLVNIRMATCAKQSHICSQWFMHSLVCMPCVSTSIAQLIKYYATNAIPC